MDPVFSEFYHEYIIPDTSTKHVDGDTVTMAGDGSVSGTRYGITFINGEYIDRKTKKL